MLSKTVVPHWLAHVQADARKWKDKPLPDPPPVASSLSDQSGSSSVLCDSQGHAGSRGAARSTVAVCDSNDVRGSLDLSCDRDCPAESRTEFLDTDAHILNRIHDSNDSGRENDVLDHVDSGRANDFATFIDTLPTSDVVSASDTSTTTTSDIELCEDFDTDPLFEINAVDFDITPPTNFPDVKTSQYISRHDPHVKRANVDTGAWCTCTDDLSLVHNYRKFTKENPCPITLKPASDGSDAVPRGWGYLHVPAHNDQGFLAVRVFYSPKLRTTVIDERDFIRAAGLSPKKIRSENIVKYYDAGTFTYYAVHKSNAAFNVVVHGILRNGKLYTGALIPAGPDDATRQQIRDDPSFDEDCKKATLLAIYRHQEEAYRQLRDEMRNLPQQFHQLPFHEYIQKHTPVNAIRKDVERLLWHQRLGHPSDGYLFNAHKHIKGVPKFTTVTSVLDTCPTCIRAKQTKSPHGPNTTRTAEQPYQGLSIDFSFAGQKSKNGERAKDFVGLNGETCWILVTDHFTRMKHGDTRVSKASPLQWLRDFLKNHSPDCDDKYVMLDQGGELYGNPEVIALFKEFGYAIRVTGADASNQNGPVERGHQVVSNAIRALLTGANLPIKFWPYAFYHWLRIDNSLPSRDQTLAPFELATKKQDDFTNFRTFGCRVWVRPPGRRNAKFRSNSIKGIFLGYIPRTTKNILWYDPETSRVKIARHARFDEGMNDLPASEIPPNIVHFERLQHGAREDIEDPIDIQVSPFDADSSPFFHVLAKDIRVRCRDRNFGITVATDEINNRAFVHDIKNNSSASKIFSTVKATKNAIRGAYIVNVDGTPVFTKDEVLASFKKLHDDGKENFGITFAPERRLTAAQIRQAVRENDIHAPAAMIDVAHNHQLTFADIRAIAAVRHHGESIPFDEDSLPLEIASATIHAIKSSATTKEEQNLGNFTRRKLKNLSTWPLWQEGEHKQLDQFHALQMYGEPVQRTKDMIVLRQHWQYHIKRNGTRRSRNCCDGSPRSAPMLHKFGKTYSSCVEQPVQRLFFALAAQMNFRIFGGDAKDAYAHSPAPTHPCYAAVDDAYFEWFQTRFPDKRITKDMVLPIQHALQGHPESGRLWERHISTILASTSFNFQSTTHDRCIYRGTFKGHTLLLLRQVDDFALAAPSEDIAKEVYETIGKELQLPSEDKVPFSYLGLMDDFNGVDVHQYSDRIVISAEKYIDRIMQTHGWDTPSHSELDPNKPQSPIPSTAIPTLYNSEGFAEGTKEHQRLIDKYKFTYRTLLGELLFAYVTCRPDIGYAVITLSKFASKPGDFHFSMLKKVAKYVRSTKTWGIHFHRNGFDKTLPSCPFETLSADPSLPEFPDLEEGTKLTCFIDAAHANDLRQRRSTTGYAFMMSGGSISYKCKTQPITATSSTEAEFYAAVTAGKQARYLRAILHELGFPQENPTPIYCDNESAINMVNNQIPTERARHIHISWFAIQDWKTNNDIVMRHIPGILNPSDDLTKPLGWILHSRHSRRLMGHYSVLPTKYKPSKKTKTFNKPHR